jgi:hypothetical protein
VAALTAPRAGRSLLGKLSLTRPAGRDKPSRLAAALTAAREHIVTAAALGSFDFGAFHVPGHWGMCCGFVAAGVSLLAFDFAVRG